MAPNSFKRRLFVMGSVIASLSACATSDDGSDRQVEPTSGSGGSGGASKGGTGGAPKGNAGSGGTTGAAGKPSTGGTSAGGTSAGEASIAGGTSGGTPAGGSVNGGSSAAGAGGTSGSAGTSQGCVSKGVSSNGGRAGASGSEPRIGCTKLTLLFDDLDGSKAECDGLISDSISTLRFEISDPFHYTFVIKTDLKPGQTGTFVSIVDVQSRSLFASPWQSKPCQCTLHVSAHEVLAKSTRITGSVVCNPKGLLGYPIPIPEAAVDIEKWEFTAVLPLEQ